MSTSRSLRQTFYHFVTLIINWFFMHSKLLIIKNLMNHKLIKTYLWFLGVNQEFPEFLTRLISLGSYHFLGFVLKCREKFPWRTLSINLVWIGIYDDFGLKMFVELCGKISVKTSNLIFFINLYSNFRLFLKTNKL